MESNLPLCLPQTHDSYLPAMPLLSGEFYRYTNKSEAVPSEIDWSYIGATEKPKGREDQSGRGVEEEIVPSFILAGSFLFLYRIRIQEKYGDEILPELRNAAHR